MDFKETVELDLRHFWHPCTQMKDCEKLPPLPVESASGSIIRLKDGREVIDGTSSWWCKSLGHGNRRIKEAFIGQLSKFEHVIMANCCSEPVAELCSKLASLAPGLDRVFLAENGSVSVEIAMKMSLQYHAQTGHPEKKHFMSFENGYHGETILTLAAGDCDLYSAPFKHLLPEIKRISPLPYNAGTASGNFDSCPEDVWRKIESQLSEAAPRLAGIVFEPVLQGAGGMLIYSPDLLRRLHAWADKNGVHLIADEIMTGFGRTGKMLACEHAGIIPDFAVVSKGLTSGYVPMAAVITSNRIYEAFYADYFSGRGFMHSTTYCGYAPAAAAALEVIRIFEEEGIIASVQKRSPELLERMKSTASKTSALTNLRSVGFVAAADIVNPETGKPFDRKLRTGFRFLKNAVTRGAILRPLGDTIYFLPPLNTPDSQLDRLAEIAADALNATLKEKI